MNMKCNSWALSLLLFLALLVSGYKWWPFLKQGPPTPKFDYLRLVFQWPNSFCNVRDGNSSCTLPVPDYFSLHGFWPQKDTGPNPEFCPSEKNMTDEILEDFRKDLVKIWPNLLAKNWSDSKSLYKHQWRKHGTCSESKFGPKEYLETALELGGQYKLKEILKNNTKNNKREPIVPDSTRLYKTRDIWDAVYKDLKKIATVKCNNRTQDEYQLYEIHLCFRFQKVGESEELNMTDCKGGPIRCEGKEEAYYPNTCETELSRVPSEKALVSELEDEAEL